jgi:hypothetical protein
MYSVERGWSGANELLQYSVVVKVVEVLELFTPAL